MKKRVILAMLSIVVFLLLIAPAANAVWVSGINPWRANPGETVGCTVTGIFALDGAGSPPQFELLQGMTVITGSAVTMWDAGSAYTTFTIPRTAPPGAYELCTSQTVGGVLERDYFAGAFAVNDLAPHITSATPGYSYVGDPDQNVHVIGYGFQESTPGHQGSVLKFNGVAMPTAFVSTTELIASFYYTCFQTPGIRSIAVTNVADDWTSPAWPYSVIMPTPTLDSLDRTSVEAGSSGIQITALGVQFASVAVMTFGGTDLTTSVDGPTRVRGTVPASLLTTPGTVNVTIRNGPSGPSSASLSFTIIGAPVSTPVISMLSPLSAPTGGPTIPLHVFGSGFVNGGAGASMVYWTTAGASPTTTGLPTMFVSSTELSAPVPASTIGDAGTAYVTVHNGVAPGAPVSVPYAFTVTAPGAPAITSLGPNSATAGAAAFDLTVNGSGFAAGAVIVWNSTDLTTTRTSATELHAQVPAGLIATAGSATVTVRNGAAGAAVSNALPFTITGSGGGGAFALTSLEPTQVWAGYAGPGVTLAVNGSGFVSGAHIWLGTQEKTATTFVSATRLTTTLLPAELASVGTIQVSVKNPGGVAGPSTLPLAVSTETTDPTVTIAGADSGWHNSPVALTFSGADSQSGVQKVQYRCPPAVGSWTDGTSYTVPVTTQGAIGVSAQAFDWCGRVGSASATVKIDTTKPGTDALNAVSVKRGKIAKLRFRVSEPSDLSPTATVTIQVKKGGKVVKTKTLNSVPMNATEVYSFRVNLKKGSYSWYLSATDLAGNPQVKVDKASFRVK